MTDKQIIILVFGVMFGGFLFACFDLGRNLYQAIKFLIKKPPFPMPYKCRIFDHKFEETEYPICVDGGAGILFHKLYVCKRCSCGRVFGIFGYDYYEPKTVKTFLARKAMKAV